MRYVLGLSALALACAFLLAAFLYSPAQSQECVTVQQDREKAERAGLQWLGIRDVPYTDGIQFVYYNARGTTFFSPVFNGCVSSTALPLGKYVPEVNV